MNGRKPFFYDKQALSANCRNFFQCNVLDEVIFRRAMVEIALKFH